MWPSGHRRLSAPPVRRAPGILPNPLGLAPIGAFRAPRGARYDAGAGRLCAPAARDTGRDDRPSESVAQAAGLGGWRRRHAESPLTWEWPSDSQLTAEYRPGTLTRVIT